MEPFEPTFSNQVAIVTGAGQGMGMAIARQFAKKGAAVVINDINDVKARRVAEKLSEKGYRALGLRADVTEEHQIASMVEETIDYYGTVSILVNSAGILYPTRVDHVTKSEWDHVLDVNLNGPFVCSKAVLPIMKKRKYGRIINLSSSAGRSVSTLGGIHYTASKAGVLGLTRAMAKEVAPFGITVNAVCPGLIDTEMVRLECTAEQIAAYETNFPISRLGTPDEVAQLVFFLVANSPYITGAAIDINGGDLMM